MEEYGSHALGKANFFSGPKSAIGRNWYYKGNNDNKYLYTFRKENKLKK
jgi:hypothetical protein